MEQQLEQLLTVANTVIPTLVESYNESTRDYNQLVTEMEELETRLELYADTINKQDKLLKQQADKLDSLAKQHREVIRLSNDKISNLENELKDTKADLKLLTQLNPRKLEKTNKEQKKRLADRQTALEAERTKVRNLTRDKTHVEDKLNNQKIGFWRNNTERLIENLTNKDLTLTNLSIETSLDAMVWWQHECGIKLLYGLNPEDNTIYCCDVIDPDTGEQVKPSYQAVEAMKAHFKQKLGAKR